MTARTPRLALACNFDVALFAEDSVSINGSDTDNYKPSGDYHDITRYMREIDSSLARDRRQRRCDLFDVYKELPVSALL